MLTNLTTPSKTKTIPPDSNENKQHFLRPHNSSTVSPARTIISISSRNHFEALQDEEDIMGEMSEG